MKKSKSLIIISVICLIIVVVAVINGVKTKTPTYRNEAPQKIVSLSPSITEVVFAIGAGKKVVGVTAFDKYPKEVESLPRVGGFLDPDFEKIITLSPQLIITRTDNIQANNKLKRLGFKLLAVEHTSIEGILNSISEIGTATGCTQKAKMLRLKIERLIHANKTKTTLTKKPKIMLCISRNFGSGSIKDVYVAGNDKLYDKIINFAGGINACHNVGNKYPKLSAENIEQINPDIIIELVPKIRGKKVTSESIRKEWHKLKFIKAVEKNNIYVITKDYAVLPGPRIFGLITDFEQIINESKK